MKVKSMAWLLIVSLLVVVIGMTTVDNTAAQTQGDVNLLVNPGFESGHHKQDGVPELTVPDGWYLHYLDGVNFLGSSAPAARPESVVWWKGDAPASEQGLFFRDGNYTMKIFKGGLPMYAALSQDVGGLEVGRRYRLVAPIFIDIVNSYNADGSKSGPGNLESGLVRLGASPTGASWLDEGAIAYSGWWTAATISPFYQAFPIFVYDFTATQANMTVWIEFGSRDSYPNNGFFVDTLGLYTLDEVDNTVNNPPASNNPPAVQGPPPTPFPTPTPRADGAIVHVVQSGDSLWGIAIRYASAVGMTAEELLPIIRELNGNPAFVSVGQEILVSEPSANAVEEPAVEEPAETEVNEPAGGEVETEPTAEPEEAEATATPEPEPTAEPVATSNAVCVAAFLDANASGTQDGDEGLLADAVFTIARSSGTVATYVSDGMSEPYCVTELEADTYQVSFSPPAGYKATTSTNWAIAVSGGSEIPVQFGAQVDAAAVAEAQPELISETPATEETENTAESGGIGSNIGLIAIGVAVVLAILTGIGLVLLRRS